MSSNTEYDGETPKRAEAASYSTHNPVPTIKKYQAEKEEREAAADSQAVDSQNDASPRSIKSKSKSILSSAKGLLRTGSMRSVSRGSGQKDLEPYKAENRNHESSSSQVDGNSAKKSPSLENEGSSSSDQPAVIEKPSPSKEKVPHERLSADDQVQELGHHKVDGPDPKMRDGGPPASEQKDQDSQKPMEDTSEAIDGALDAREKRKQMKHMDRDEAGREVTDPVTHLRTKIHDSTAHELDNVPENIPPPGTQPRSATGLSGKRKSSSQFNQETEQQQLEHNGMLKLFPPPDFDAAKLEIAGIYRRTLSLGLVSSLSASLLLLVGVQSTWQLSDGRGGWLGILASSLLLLLLGGLSGALTLYLLRGWMQNRIHSVWEDHVWEGARQKEIESFDSKVPESVQWLNSLLASLWGLINPDLFTSLIDTLEDVMQASLPALVRMVSVEDLGQGSESIRILGIRWLPTGAAAMSVSEDGKAKPGGQNDRKVSGEGQVETGEDSNAHNESPTDESNENTEEENVAEGLEGEEGDFVNVECAFSYRASTTSRKLSDKTKNAHIFLAFYLPGGLKFPVWVELRGIVGTMRLRLQLCPDPPFISMCTLTFLGQPKVDLSCTPLTKKGLNIMDLPLISSFVQSSIDAALAQYVAPKSLTLDLKSMLVGDDFKKDTTARGLLVVRIRQGREFKQGDSKMLGLKEGSSDPYVAVGWAKFGKPVWSTRVIMEDMHPVWDETAYILVTPEELNAHERLRVQLWDSDRGSADDDLGRIEVDLKELMANSESHGRMWQRSDEFQSLDDGEKMPGVLDWSVGYFPKLGIQPEQLQKQDVEPKIRNLQDLKEQVSKDADRKLREATDRNETQESDQQKAQDLKEREDAMIISTPPLRSQPSGILSIQIHEITGIEYEQLSKNPGKSDTGDEDFSGDDDLPSAYCTIILNHQQIFRTRTKPKNAKPFFNAGTERFIRDWQTSQVMIAVRDSRVHENDALLGLLYLPLAKVLKSRAQVIGRFPLVGGIGHGRARISLLFRSVNLQLSKELLGWDLGTVQITQPISCAEVPAAIDGLRLKLRTSINRAKMYPSQDEGQGKHWSTKRENAVNLAVRKRYCSCLVFEFRKNSVGVDKTVAFGVLWLKDVPDEEETVADVAIWRTEKDNLNRGTVNITQDLGEKLGSIRVPLKFHRGLGAYHQKLASKNPNLQDVFEVLTTADENKEVRIAIRGDNDSDTSSDSDSSDSDSDKDVNDGKGGPISKIKHYKDHSDQLHRHQRGLMQWKGARTADYLKTKAGHGKDNLLDRFKHHDRDSGIETEV